MILKLSFQENLQSNASQLHPNPTCLNSPLTLYSSNYHEHVIFLTEVNIINSETNIWPALVKWSWDYSLLLLLIVHTGSHKLINLFCAAHGSQWDINSFLLWNRHVSLHMAQHHRKFTDNNQVCITFASPCFQSSFSKLCLRRWPRNSDCILIVQMVRWCQACICDNLIHFRNFHILICRDGRLGPR